MGKALALLRRLARLLFVLSPAAAGLLFRHGPQHALAYLHHCWTLYLWPDMVPLFGPSALPEAAAEAHFPGLDLERAEVFFPMPRPGGVRLVELVVLNALVRHLRPRRLVEIGTAEGRTTLNLCRSAPEDAELITLDLPAEAPAPVVQSGPDFRQLGFSGPGEMLDRLPEGRVRRILADSTRFDWTPYEGGVDFVFIDGGHDYETVRRDTENALRIVRAPGVILWHDYNVYRGVTRCLAELARERPVVRLARTSLGCLRVDAPPSPESA